MPQIYLQYDKESHSLVRGSLQVPTPVYELICLEEGFVSSIRKYDVHLVWKLHLPTYLNIEDAILLIENFEDLIQDKRRTIFGCIELLRHSER